jgi:lipopolysaccharide biosynthesis protein
VVLILIPILVAMMLFIARQYRSAGVALAVRPDAEIPRGRREERVLVPVPGINRAVIRAINVGRSIAPDVRAVLVSDDPAEAARIRQQWERQLGDIPLVFVESPYRALVGPLLAYLDVLDQAWESDKEAPITFVVIPEYVARSWWERILYNQSARRLRTALLGRRHTVVVNVPYRPDDPDETIPPTPGAA